MGSFVVPAVVAGHLKAVADASRDSQAILGELLLRSTFARTGRRSATPRYGCRLPDRTSKRNTPGDRPGAPCRVVPVGVAMMAVATAFFLRLLHDCRIPSGTHPREAGGLVSTAPAARTSTSTAGAGRRSDRSACGGRDWLGRLRRRRWRGRWDVEATDTDTDGDGDGDGTGYVNTYENVTLSRSCAPSDCCFPATRGGR